MRLRSKTNGLALSQPPRRRRFLAALTGSALLHALVLLAMPQMDARVAPRVEILRVEIEKPQPPREIESEPPRERARAPRPAPPPSQEQRRQALAKPQRAAPPKAPAPAPALTSRELLTASPQPVQREQAYAAPAPEAVAQPAIEAPRAAQPAPEGAAAPTVKSSPPRISDARVIDSPVRYPRTPEQGRVTLKVLVNREGRVARAALAKTSGYPGLDQHALQAVRRWRFAPAWQGEEPVEQWLTVNVDY